MVKESDIEATLSAFMHGEEEMCIHMLCKKAGLPREVLRFVLVELQKQGKIERARAKVTGDAVYRLKSNLRIASTEIQQVQRLVGGIDEETARNRVAMLKRMKARLISDWHPIIDILLRDYEGSLTKMDVELDPKGAVDGEFHHIWS